MMTTMTEPAREERREESLTDFLADYAAALLASGATCIRIEKNVKRIARRLGAEADITVLPRHVEVALWSGEGGGKADVAVRRTGNSGVNFSHNAALSRLSWDIADGRCSFAEARARFRDIVSRPPTGKWEVLLLASAANASFCRLFGGDAAAMAIVFISTLAGFRLKQIMLEAKADARVTVLCASFFSAALSAGGHVFGIGATPEIALGTSVLYLVPGVPYINAVSDIIDRHYLCALSRIMDASITTICLSAGLCLGMMVLGLRWF